MPPGHPIVLWVEHIQGSLIKRDIISGLQDNLDIFWSNQEVYYNFKCDITRAGNSESELISNYIKVYKDVDIEASKPASSTPIQYMMRYCENRAFKVIIDVFLILRLITCNQAKDAATVLTF